MVLLEAYGKDPRFLDDPVCAVGWAANRVGWQHRKAGQHAARIGVEDRPVGGGPDASTLIEMYASSDPWAAVHRRLDVEFALATLCPRDRQIARGLAAGYRYREIGAALGVSHTTVHLRRGVIGAALAAYADGLGESSKAQLKAAVRLYSNAMLDQLKGRADPSNVDFIRAAEYRTQALQDAVKVSAPKGQKTHTWLSRAEVIALLDTCNGDTLKAERDRLALGLLVAAGLRREEACSLAFGDVKLQPVKGKMRTVLAIQGKGKKNRTVPISDNLANAIDQWGGHVGHEGRVLRSIDQAGKLRESLSTVGLFHVVRDHGARIGKPELAPHDLRRSYAQLGFESNIPITQISKLLGHANVATTQKYLNLDLDLEVTISDFIPF